MKAIAVPSRRSPPALETPEDRARQLVASRRHPGAFLPITKCGTTFLMRLWWHIETGAPFPNPKGIHKAKDSFPKVEDPSPEAVRANPHAFVVVRDPVARFFSLYFDKFALTRKPNGQPALGLRHRLEPGESLIRAPRSVGDHRANCETLLAVFERSLTRPDLQPNPHWDRQALRVNRTGREMGLAVLTLEAVETQLQVLLGDRIPDLDHHVAAISRRNTSGRAVHQDDIATPEMEARIRQLYARDLAIWTWARDAWASLDMTARDPHLAPRLTPQDE